MPAELGLCMEIKIFMGSGDIIDCSCHRAKNLLGNSGMGVGKEALQNNDCL